MKGASATALVEDEDYDLKNENGMTLAEMSKMESFKKLVLVENLGSLDGFKDRNYPKLSAILFAFGVVTMLINTIYGFVEIFDTSSVPEIIPNGTLVQSTTVNGT